MLTYILRRVLLAVPTLLGVSIVAFVLVALSPGDAALACGVPRRPARALPERAWTSKRKEELAATA